MMMKLTNLLSHALEKSIDINDDIITPLNTHKVSFRFRNKI